MSARERRPVSGMPEEELEEELEEEHEEALTEEEEQQLVMGWFKEVARKLRPDLHPLPAPPIQAGRNDPCPCGSGRKYKRCHGAGQDGA